MCIEDYEKSVCTKIKNWREDRHMSQMDLAVSANISQSIITYVEQGKRSPSLRTLLRICKALNINPAALFTESDSEIEKKKDEIKRLINEL